MGKFAENTSVPVERSKAEIETTAMRYGATGFISGWQGEEAMVTFQIRDRRVRFNLPLPDKNDPAFTDVGPKDAGSGNRRPTRSFVDWASDSRRLMRQHNADDRLVVNALPWSGWHRDGKFPSEAVGLYLEGTTARKRDPAEAARLWEQACRQKWRALALAVKAKLEAVESGISSFEEEFMAHIVTSSGKTIGEMVMPQLPSIVHAGKMPKMLGGPERSE